jgi:hypothetical protein
VLQTIASGCETPEPSLLRALNIVDPLDPAFSIPKTFDELIEKVKPWLTSLAGQLPAWLPNAVKENVPALITKLDSLKDDVSADESTKERIFNELLRELAASGWGRRDAQWALQGALSRAQRFVYIETPGIGPTGEKMEVHHDIRDGCIRSRPCDRALGLGPGQMAYNRSARLCRARALEQQPAPFNALF